MTVTRNVGLVTDAHKTMIFVLILIAWLTIVAIIVNACRSAARGDEMLAASGASATPPPRGDSAGALWQDDPRLAGAHEIRLTHLGGLSRHGSRVRGGCAAGS